MHVDFAMTTFNEPTLDGISAGVEWIAKRWRSASKLTMRGDATVMQALAQKLHRGCTDLASIQSAMVDTFRGKRTY